MNKLIISIGKNNISVAANGCGAKNSLFGFAKLIGSNCVNEDKNVYDLLLTDEHISSVEGCYSLPNYEDLSFIWDLQNGVILHHNSLLPPWVSGEWQQVILLSVLKKMITYKNIFIMHGALLEVAQNKGIILYGHSGVGKSTTVTRCRMAEINCRGDDIILCTLQNNILYASPLPTASYYREYYTKNLCYPLCPELEIVQLLHLKRGEICERIVEIPRDEWFAPLVHALTFHYLPHLQILPNAVNIGNIILDLAMHLATMFNYKALEANYSGNIAKTLMAIK